MVIKKISMLVKVVKLILFVWNRYQSSIFAKRYTTYTVKDQHIQLGSQNCSESIFISIPIINQPVSCITVS